MSVGWSKYLKCAVVEKIFFIVGQQLRGTGRSIGDLNWVFSIPNPSDRDDLAFSIFKISNSVLGRFLRLFFRIILQSWNVLNVKLWTGFANLSSLVWPFDFCACFSLVLWSFILASLRWSVLSRYLRGVRVIFLHLPYWKERAELSDFFFWLL